MDLKVLWKNYAYPVLFAAVGAGFTWLQTNKPEVFDFLTAVGLTPTATMVAIAGLLGFVMTKFNPVAGKDQSWFVPDSKHGETPSLRAPLKKK